MRKVLLLFLVLLCVGPNLFAQTYNEYEISFENAVHHEAIIKARFSNLEDNVLEIRMSRSSPGRYALHEFAKNVYSVKAYDSKGKELNITRPNPHQWDVSGHDGIVIFQYTLFANRGGGTYSQVDETHAHLNIPATFAYARGLGERPVKVTFDLREDLNWKVATQLKHLEGNTYMAPDTYYFMDSPTEIADLHIREEKIEGKTIRMALHTPASEAEVDDYFGKVIKIVKAESDVYGGLADYDFGEYTFLLCFMPNASGDGMEHRNSTYVVSSKPLQKPLGETSISTVSHEFFHSWNVERMRPQSLEPFDFEEANMSGELWFAEGFTQYYTALNLVRAGILAPDNYIQSLAYGLNAVINSPGRNYFNPIEMSYQAPFVDAARSVDPTNRSNTFISYYTYGQVLGLALDLSLRSLDKGLNLDDFMKNAWNTYGKTEIPYDVRDLQVVLEEYAGKNFADEFFGNYIFDSKLPDFAPLLKNVGVVLEKENVGKASLGENIRVSDGIGRLRNNATVGSPVYEAGIELEDELVSVAGIPLSDEGNVETILQGSNPGDQIEIVFNRWGVEKTVTVTLIEDRNFKTTINEKADKKALNRQKDWLKTSE